MSGLRVPLLAAVCALLASGCTVVRVTRAFNGVNVDEGRAPLATVEIENSGWYLFTCIPIASGNHLWPNSADCCWFTDTVTVENNLSVLEKVMLRERANEVVNLTSRHTDEKYLVCLLSRRAYHTSAVLLRPQSNPSQTPSK